MSNYRLDKESLLDYAKCVSAIRLKITQRVEQLDDSKGEKVEEVGENETVGNLSHLRVNSKACRADF